MFRIGLGFDSHPFDNRGTLKLGGIEISEVPSLKGVSDGDALLHAIADAIIGGISKGDIGDYFPPQDPLCRGIDSSIILKKAIELMKKQEKKIVNIDAVVICDKVRLKPYVEKIKKKVAEITLTDPENINIKPKSSEGSGIIRNGDGIVCIANVLLMDSKES